MNARRWWCVAAVALAAAISLRLAGLSAAPLQSDEAVNWYLSQEVSYSPQAFHGPLFFHLLRFFGRDSEWALRLAPAAAGVLLTLSPILLIGAAPAAAIALLMLLLALDPLLGFYSHVAIHESLFALLSALAGVAWFRALRSDGAAWAALAGACLGLAAATKETFPLTLAALAAASLALRPKLERTLLYSLALAGAVGVLTCALTLGGSGALVDLVRGVSNWAERGFQDETQTQPWWYFVGLIGLTDATLLAALLLGLPRPSPSQRYFLAWALLLLLVHSALPYKTPWLAINLVLPIYAAFALSRPAALPAAIVVLLLALNPFGNAPLRVNDTYAEMPALAARVVNQCKLRGPSCRVLVNVPWYWPLPFYLRELGGAVTYSAAPRPPTLALDAFDVVIFPAEATRQAPGWRREESALSRLQPVAIYWKEGVL